MSQLITNVLQWRQQTVNKRQRAPFLQIAGEYRTSDVQFVKRCRFDPNAVTLDRVLLSMKNGTEMCQSIENVMVMNMTDTRSPEGMLENFARMQVQNIGADAESVELRQIEFDFPDRTYVLPAGSNATYSGWLKHGEIVNFYVSTYFDEDDPNALYDYFKMGSEEYRSKKLLNHEEDNVLNRRLGAETADRYSSMRLIVNARNSLGEEFLQVLELKVERFRITTAATLL